MSFQALIVDYGVVLTTPLQDAMVAFADELGIELQDLVRVALSEYAGGSDPLVVSFETGQMPEAEFTREFAARLSEVTSSPVEPDGLVGRLFGGMSLEEGMFEAVAAAQAAGFKTALLSNSWGLDLYPRVKLAQLFDVIVISGEVGLRKPDPAIFELTTDKLDVPHEACVFVDDHPGHLKAAQELGMTTVLHRSPDETVAELEGLLGIGLRQG